MERKTAATISAVAVLVAGFILAFISRDPRIVCADGGLTAAMIILSLLGTAASIGSQQYSAKQQRDMTNKMDSASKAQQVNAGGTASPVPVTGGGDDRAVQMQQAAQVIGALGQAGQTYANSRQQNNQQLDNWSQNQQQANNGINWNSNPNGPPANNRLIQN
ncbi:MAG: hypothetical protein EOM20_03375 [Spartobacteria bacterium]|nr:hypothetical protein [Spartobacteria bacterium]